MESQSVFQAETQAKMFSFSESPSLFSSCSRTPPNHRDPSWRSCSRCAPPTRSAPWPRAASFRFRGRDQPQQSLYLRVEITVRFSPYFLMIRFYRTFTWCGMLSSSPLCHCHLISGSPAFGAKQRRNGRARRIVNLEPIYECLREIVIKFDLMVY